MSREEALGPDTAFTDDQKAPGNSELSPWAEFIGPLYTADRIARELDWTADQLIDADRDRSVLSLQTEEGSLLYPVPQVKDGKLLVGVGWVLSTLDPVMDRYTMSAWLSNPRDSLDGQSAWNSMRLSDPIVPDRVKELVTRIGNLWSR